MAARGPKMLELAGREADGVVLMVKADLGPALENVGEAEDEPVTRIYLDRMAYTPEMLEDARRLYMYAVMDSPPRMLHALGMSDEEIEAMQTALQEEGVAAAADHVTMEMIRNFQVAGTKEECSRSLRELIDTHQLDVFLLNITSAGLEDNRQVMADIAAIAWEAEEVG